MIKKERSRWEIVRDMLAVPSEEKNATKTGIMQRAYLNSVTFQKYFDFLLEESFIRGCNPKDGYYELTKKGQDLLKRLREVDEIMH